MEILKSVPGYVVGIFFIGGFFLLFLELIWDEPLNAVVGKLKKVKEWLWKHEAFYFVLILIALIWFIWWLAQPIDIMYSPDAPIYECDDDPEGGYLPRC